MQSAGEYALRRVFLFVLKRALGRLVVDHLDLVAVRSPRSCAHITGRSADIALRMRCRRASPGRRMHLDGVMSPH
jgi:hypothetical protein